MSKGLQLTCVWCGPAFAVIFFIGMIMAGLLPPPSPHDSTMSVAHFWQDHVTVTRFGLVLMMFAGGLTAPYGAMLCVMLRRIEPGDSPMTYLQMLGAATGVIAICFPTFFFMAASFRPDRAPGLIKTLNDVAWIPFVINTPPALMQCLSISGAVLTDRSGTSVFPRWVGYYNAWTAFLFMPGGLIIFFKHGAFAWNGLLAFWLVAVLFGTWFVVMSVMMMQAIKRHAAAEARGGRTTGGASPGTR
jgi:hypothetical protein